MKDYMGNITWIDSSHITKTLNQNKHIVKRKGNNKTKYIESFRIYEKSLEKAVYTISQRLSMEETALPRNKKCSPWELIKKACT